MLESTFKKNIKDKLLTRFPDIEIFEPDSGKKRSVPDMLIFGPGAWAALEFKRSENSAHQPNQDRRVERLSKKGYAAFIFPENEKEILHELEELFGS